jgi:predicted transcriptional regulator
LKPLGAKPDQEKRAKVKALREARLTLSQIAAEMGVTPQAVSMMLTKMRAEATSGGAAETTRTPP